MSVNHTDRLLRRMGVDRADFSPRSRLGATFRAGGVVNSMELRRIVALPSYSWEEDPGVEELRVSLTDLLALPPREPGTCLSGCPCKGTGRMELRPIQAAALQAAHDFSGALCPVRVGGGKTLLSFLLGTVLELERVLLLVPAKLHRKTGRDFLHLRRHWIAPQGLHVMSYELLSRDRGLEELEELRPQLVIADEGHKLKNTRAACTRRVRRYLRESGAMFVDMSGTLTKRSLLEYHHRAGWALPGAFLPLPQGVPEAADWAKALDEKVKDENRLAPGALLQLCTTEELHELGAAPTLPESLRIVRQAYRRRLMTTPGVVGTTELFDGAMPIIITGVELDHGPEILEAVAHLRGYWETPDRHPIADAVALWRHARELVCGFFYRWDPPAPEAWLFARKEWARFVREVLKHSRKYDTELQVARACARGDLPPQDYRRWKEVRDTFKPNSVPVWLSNDTIRYAADWLLDNSGICWVEHTAFGRRLSDKTGIPYFGQGGLDIQGRSIDDWPGGPIIASIQANAEGRNLQDRYSRNLVVSAPPNGALWEQMIGRTHRDGQDAEEVTFDVLLSCRETGLGFHQAVKDAAYIEHTTGQPQKLLFADVDVISEEEMEAKAGPLWAQ